MSKKGRHEVCFKAKIVSISISGISAHDSKQTDGETDTIKNIYKLQLFKKNEV